MPTRKWGSEQLVNRTTAGNQSNAVTTVLKNGNFIVVWQSVVDEKATIRGQIFNTAGDRVGGELLIDQASTGDSVPSIAALSDGGFIVSAEHASAPGDRDIYSFVYGANGVFKSRITAASTADESNPDVARFDQDYESIVVWEDAASNAGDISAILYNTDGSIRSTLVVNAKRDGPQSQPAVATSLGGGLATVVWKDFTGIKGMIIGNGAANGQEFQVSAPTADLLDSPDITYVARGRFVVTWSAFNQGSGGGIHARLFQVIGGIATAITDDVFANSSSNGSDPTVTRLPNSGGFVVSWSESNIFLPTTGPDSSGSSIHLQAFDGSGAKIGGEIIVNTTMAESQYKPSVTALQDGRVAVTWTDASMTGGDPSGTAIRMQIVDPRDGLIYGSGDADLLYGNDFANDEMLGGMGADRLLGLRGDDNIFGGDGDDTLIGGLGADSLTGGSGVDTASYASSSAGVVVDLATNANAGGEAAGDFLAEIENLVGSNFADDLRGDAGGNRLDGGGGADILTGRGGSDAYLVDSAGDRVIEARGGGTDTVFASGSYALAVGQEIETLRTFGSGGKASINLTGNEFAQTLQGNAGANALDGRGGADRMEGFGGNDIYAVDQAGDLVIEARGGGSDTVIATASWVLTAGQEVEAVQLAAATGSRALNLTGNEFGQKLMGYNGANVLDGKGGADVLTGRAGADSFVFSTAVASTNVDRITDFAAEDTMRLAKSVFSALAPGQLAESAFKNISAGTADATDRILYKQTTGELFYDADGSGKGLAVKFAVLDNKVALGAGDFLVF
jgi:Ca2+-binding RTX toxin-like protein